MAHRCIFASSARQSEKKSHSGEINDPTLGINYVVFLRFRPRRTLMIKPSAMAANWNLRHHVCVRVLRSNLARLSFVWSKEPLDDIKRSFGAENVFLFSQQQTRRRKKLKAESSDDSPRIRAKKDERPSVAFLSLYRGKSRENPSQTMEARRLDTTTCFSRWQTTFESKKRAALNNSERYKTWIETLLTA